MTSGLKITKNPSTALYPCPVVLVTSVAANERPNIITLAWVGTVCSDPPVIGIGIRPERHSYKLVKNSGEFVVNVPNADILKEVDQCGVVSGRDVDKFSDTGLTPTPAENMKAPLILECPVNIECTVMNEIPVGAHHLFLGKIVSVHISQEFLNENNRIDFAKVAPLVFNQGEYWILKRKIGCCGFSKKKT